MNITITTTTTAFLAAAIALSPAAGQQPDYVFRTVAHPGMTIAGHELTDRTVIGSAALNDSGDFAFIAMEPAQPPEILTPKRVVVRQDEVIEGRAILIAAHGQLAINNSGQVAYEAWWSTDPNDFESPGKSGAGIFVDRRLVLSIPWNDPVPEFTLTDDGRILTRAARPAAREQKAGPDLINRIRIRPPKDSPVSIAPARPQPRVAPQPPLPLRVPVFQVNRRGEVLVPINFEGGSFGILFGTPTHR